MNRSKLAFVAVLVLAAGALSVWSARMISTRSAERQGMEQLKRENQELRAAVEKLRAANVLLEGRAKESELDAVETPASPKASERRLSYIDDIGTISALRDSLALANKTIEELQARSAEQQTQLDQMRQEQKRLAAMESDLDQQLASVRKAVEAKEAELSRKSDELAQLESSNRQLRKDSEAAASKSNRLLQTSNELQELYRRRESYLSTLLSRYREITEQYRAFASVLENRRGPEGTPGSTMSVAGPELSRIQSSITMAEEDLRQLNSLNAQVLRLQKRLSGN